jgi:hypothetical protein
VWWIGLLKNTWTDRPKILWPIDPLLGNVSVNTIPREPTCATIKRLLLGNWSVNTPKTIRDNIRRCFLWGPPRGCIMRRSKGSVCCRELGRVLEVAVKGDCEEMARNQRRPHDWLKLQWDGYKSVARIRLVKTENRSACVTVNRKVCRSAIALYYL